MNQTHRRCVAFLAGKILGNEGSKSVFDCSLSVQTSFSGRISDAGIFMLDLGTKRRIVGQRISDRISLAYDTEQIDLTIQEQEKTFEGFDAKSSRPFRGVVSGSSVILFDEEENQDYTFTL